MVISTSSAGSSGGTFLPGKEDEIILFLAVRDVLELLSPCTGTSKLGPYCFALVPWADAAPSLSAITQEHSEHWPWL